MKEKITNHIASSFRKKQLKHRKEKKQNLLRDKCTLIFRVPDLLEVAVAENEKDANTLSSMIRVSLLLLSIGAANSSGSKWSAPTHGSRSAMVMG